MPTFVITNNTGNNIDLLDSTDKLFPRYHRSVPTGATTSLTVDPPEGNALKTQLDAIVSANPGTFYYNIKDSIMTSAVLVVLTPAAAVADNIKTAIQGNTAANTPVVPEHQPDVPRNLAASFEAAWTGGNAVITGTTERGVAISETIVANAGNTVDGVKVFKTVTGVAHTLVGANKFLKIGYAGTTTVLGIDVAGPPADADALLIVGTAAEVVTVDTTLKAFTPTTQPDGTKKFKLLFHR